MALLATWRRKPGNSACAINPAVRNPATAIAAEHSVAFVAGVGEPGHSLRRSDAEFEGVFSEGRGEAEGAARDSLAVGAVAGVDHQRCSDDPVAEGTALASAFDREGNFSRHAFVLLPGRSVVSRDEGKMVRITS